MGESAYTTVSIFGEEYRVSGEASGISIPDLAALVNDKMAEVKSCSSTFDTKRIAVLAALNIADELFREQARSEALVKQIRSRTAELGDHLENTLADK